MAVESAGVMRPSLAARMTRTARRLVLIIAAAASGLSPACATAPGGQVGAADAAAIPSPDLGAVTLDAAATSDATPAPADSPGTSLTDGGGPPETTVRDVVGDPAPAPLETGSPDAPADGVPAPGGALKVLTFNVRYANAGDGLNAWPNRRDMVYRLLRELDADVAGLQEVLFSQLQDLDAALPAYRRLGVGRDDGRTAGEFSAILYRAARFDVESSGNFWFSDTPEVPGSRSWGNVTTRICTWARLVDKATGRAHYIYNVHLDNVSQLSREKSVQLLMKRIAERQVATDPFLVTGDFNAGETDVAIRFMKGTAPIEALPNPLPLVDSFRQLYPDATAVGTFHSFAGGTAGAKIDFIFTRPLDRTLAAAIILKQENGRYPSDHHPVSATVSFAGR